MPALELSSPVFVYIPWPSTSRVHSLDPTSPGSKDATKRLENLVESYVEIHQYRQDKCRAGCTPKTAGFELCGGLPFELAGLVLPCALTLGGRATGSAKARGAEPPLGRGRSRRSVASHNGRPGVGVTPRCFGYWLEGPEESGPSELMDSAASFPGLAQGVGWCFAPDRGRRPLVRPCRQPGITPLLGFFR